MDTEDLTCAYFTWSCRTECRKPILAKSPPSYSYVRVLKFWKPSCSQICISMSSTFRVGIMMPLGLAVRGWYFQFNWRLVHCGLFQRNWQTELNVDNGLRNYKLTTPADKSLHPIISVGMKRKIRIYFYLSKCREKYQNWYDLERYCLFLTMNLLPIILSQKRWSFQISLLYTKSAQDKGIY